MQILCHRKDPKVRKEIKMLGKGGGKNNKLGWGIYSPVLHVRTFFFVNFGRSVFRRHF